MSRINIIKREQASGALAQSLDKIKSKFGVLPNSLATFANSPAVLNGYLAFSEALSGGELDARQRESIALAVGQSNRCQYCLSAHTRIGKGAGLTYEQIDDARNAHSDDSLTDAILKLAVLIINKRGKLTDEDLHQAKSVGISDSLLIEVIGLVALNTLTNYNNLIAQADIDFPVVEI